MRFWPITRTGLGLVFRRRIFWAFLFIGLLNYLFQFFRIYVTVLPAKLAAEGQAVPRFVQAIPRDLFFDAAGESYREFLLGQSVVLMIMLGFAGSILVGNDFRFHSIAFYLSKPISRAHYFAGKFLSVFLLASTLTLAPALALWIQYGAFTESFQYYTESSAALTGLLCTGTLICVVTAAVLLGVASFFEKTIPTLVVWGGIFVFLPLVGNALRDVFRHRGGGDPWGWGLLDMWSALRWVSNVLFELRLDRYQERFVWSFGVLLGWMALSIGVFWWRIRRSDVVR